MPFDLNGLIETLAHGVSKIPSAVLAAIILGGPTAIWLITRFVHPPEVVKPVEIVAQDRLWLCGSCLSINEDRLEACYRCHRVRSAESMPVVIHGGRESSPRIGVAVGPGAAEGVPATGWLGGDFVPMPLPSEARRQSEKTVAPEQPARSRRAAPQEPWTFVEMAPAADPGSAAAEPRILEPRVKVSTRTTTAKPAGRRGRRPQGAGETN